MPQPKQLARVNLTIPVTAMFSFALDAGLKAWARQALTVGTTEPFIPGFLQLRLTSNAGAAFSLGHESGLTMTLIATTMTVILIGWAIQKEKSGEKVSAVERLGLGFLIGGALGNLGDRFLRGRVTDFFDFSFIVFPVFNLADVLIDVGIGLLIIQALRKSDKGGSDSA